MPTYEYRNLNHDDPVVTAITERERAMLNQLIQITADFHNALFYGKPMLDLEKAQEFFTSNDPFIEYLYEDHKDDIEGLTELMKAANIVDMYINSENKSSINNNFTAIPHEKRKEFDAYLDTLRTANFISAAGHELLGPPSELTSSNQKTYTASSQITPRADDDDFPHLKTSHLPITSAQHWNDLSELLLAFKNFHTQLMNREVSHDHGRIKNLINEKIYKNPFLHAFESKFFEYRNIDDNLLLPITSAGMMITRILGSPTLKPDFSNLENEDLDNLREQLKLIAAHPATGMLGQSLIIPSNFEVEKLREVKPTSEPEVKLKKEKSVQFDTSDDRYYLAWNTIIKRIKEMKGIYKTLGKWASDAKFRKLMDKLDEMSDMVIFNKDRFNLLIKTLEDAFDENMKNSGEKFFRKEKTPQDFVKKMNKNDYEYSHNQTEKLDNNFKRLLAVTLRDIYSNFDYALEFDDKRHARNRIVQGVTSLSYQLAPINKARGEEFNLASEKLQPKPQK